MYIQVLAQTYSHTYYLANLPMSSTNQVLFKMYTNSEDYPLEEVYVKFCKAMEKLSSTNVKHMQRPFYMITLDWYTEQLLMNNFSLYEYERFYKHNEKASVKLKSVFVGVSNNAMMFFFETFDGESDLHNNKILDYCDKFSQQKIKELEQLFDVEYMGTEYYI